MTHTWPPKEKPLLTYRQGTSFITKNPQGNLAMMSMFLAATIIFLLRNPSWELPISRAAFNQHSGWMKDLYQISDSRRQNDVKYEVPRRKKLSPNIESYRKGHSALSISKSSTVTNKEKFYPSL